MRIYELKNRFYERINNNIIIIYVQTRCKYYHYYFAAIVSRTEAACGSNAERSNQKSIM